MQLVSVATSSLFFCLKSFILIVSRTLLLNTRLVDISIVVVVVIISFASQKNYMYTEFIHVIIIFFAAVVVAFRPLKNYFQTCM